MRSWVGSNGDTYIATDSGGIMQLQAPKWLSPTPVTKPPLALTKPPVPPVFKTTFPNTPALN